MLDEMKNPFDPMCQRYATEIPEYRMAVRDEYDWSASDGKPNWNALTASEQNDAIIRFVRLYENTFNSESDNFVCISCYIILLDHQERRTHKNDSQTQS